MIPTPDKHPLKLLNKRETAQLLNVSTRHVDRMISEGRLPAVKLGVKAIRIRPADLAAFVAGLPDSSGR